MVRVTKWGEKTEIEQPAEEDGIQDYHIEYRKGLEGRYTLWVSVVSETKTQDSTVHTSCLTSTLCRYMPAPADTHTHMLHTHMNAKCSTKSPWTATNKPPSHKRGIDWGQRWCPSGAQTCLGRVLCSGLLCLGHAAVRCGDAVTAKTGRLLPWCLLAWMYQMDGSKLQIVSQ